MSFVDSALALKMLVDATCRHMTSAAMDKLREKVCGVIDKEIEYAQKQQLHPDGDQLTIPFE